MSVQVEVEVNLGLEFRVQVYWESSQTWRGLNRKPGYYTLIDLFESIHASMSWRGDKVDQRLSELNDYVGEDKVTNYFGPAKIIPFAQVIKISQQKEAA